MSAADVLRHRVARTILMVTQGDVDPEYAWSVQYADVQDELLAQADAVLDMLREAGLLAEPLVEKLQALCDDEWLRRRDRIMRLPGARYTRHSGAGEIEAAAAVVRELIKPLPGYDPIGSGGAYLRWCRDGRDGVEVP